MSLSKNPGRHHRRYAITLAGLVVFIAVSFAAINTWINPLWVTHAPWTDESFAEYRPIYRHQRTAKAGMVDAKPWDTAFFGSSRVDIALDPANPNWGESQAINLAVSAGSLPETERIFRYAVTHAPLKLAIIGVDVSDLSREFQGFADVGFTESRFYEMGDPAERELRYHFGISSFISSIQTLSNRSKNKLPEYTPAGHRLRTQEPANVALGIARDAISHAVRTTRVRRHSLQVSAVKEGMLRNILHDGKTHGCRIVIIIPPSHATYLGTFHYLEDPDSAFRLDRETIVRLIDESNREHPDGPPASFWDFNDFHEFNCEAIPAAGVRMHWWLDGTHARPALGDVMLARIMGWPLDGPAADYGASVTLETLDSRIEQIKQGYEDYRTNHPEMWEWMAEGIRKFQSVADSTPGPEPQP